MVVDSHCHILPDSFRLRRDELLARDATFADLFSSGEPRIATADSLVGAMDHSGIAWAAVMGIGWTDRPLAVEANDYIIESVERYPRRFAGFCSVNPAWGDAAADEVERCWAVGLRGIGELHPDTQGFDITEKSLLVPLMETAERLGIPVLVHCSEPVGHQYPGKGRTTPEKLYRFIENFPANIIICAHWGGGLPFYALMPEVAEVIKNVYFDTAASPFLYRPEVIATVVGLVGSQRVLFGSDYPLMGHRRPLRQIEEAGLGMVDLEAILGGTAARLFGR